MAELADAEEPVLGTDTQPAEGERDEHADALEAGWAHPEGGRGDLPGAVARVGFAPIVRVDEARREVELCATSEAVDSFGTVFDYEASKDAFTRWLGNVREMHDRRAVGRRVSVRHDDASRKIYVRIRISRGARDTWEKVLDGTLRGASIGASNVTWERQFRPAPGGGQISRQVATRYDLVELSLVDNPSNPDALGITFVRDAAPDVALLDRIDDEPVGPAGWGRSRTRTTPLRTEQPQQTPARRKARAISLFGRQDAPAEERTRGPFSTNDEGAPDMGVPARAEEPPTSALGLLPDGNARQRLHLAARSVLQGCGCALCEAALAVLAEDALDGSERMDHPDYQSVEGVGWSEGARQAALVRVVGAGLRTSASRLERVDASVAGLRGAVESAMGEVARSVGDLRSRLDRLEAQPLPGGPAARAAWPVEKRHLLTRSGGTGERDGEPGPAEQYRALEALAGRLEDPTAQIAVATEMIRLQRQSAGG